MIGEETQGVLWRSRKGHSAIGQQHHIVEVVEELRTRLVNGAQDGGALLGQLVQGGHQLLGTVGVQARGGLIAEQDHRIVEQLHGEGQSLAFSPRKNLLVIATANSSLGRGEKAGSLQQFVDYKTTFLFGHPTIQAKMGL